MVRFSVLLLALAVTAPVVWGALWVQDVPVEDALVHFLIAVPIMAVLAELVRAAVRPAREQENSRSANGSSPTVD